MNRSKIALATLVGLLLLAPMLAGLLGVEPRSIENRKLEKWPKLEAPSLLEPVSFEAIGAYLLDHLPLRDKAVAARSWASVHLLHDSPSPDVHLGTEGWLFYDLSFERACSGTDTPPSIVKRLRRASRIIEASGRRAIVMIIPDKNAIYPEYLGGAEPFARCAREKRAELREILTRRPPSGYVDMWDELTDLKADAGEERLYIPTDTHWTTFAAARMVEEIVERVEPGLWNPDELKREREVLHNGDLTRMMGLRDPIPVVEYAIERQGVSSTTLPASDGALPGMRIFRARSEGTARIAPLRVFFLHDSFMYTGIKMLPDYFAESAFSHWQTARHPNELSREIGSADVVVVQIAERGTYNWIHKVLSDDALAVLATASRRW